MEFCLQKSTDRFWTRFVNKFIVCEKFCKEATSPNSKGARWEWMGAFKFYFLLKFYIVIVMSNNCCTPCSSGRILQFDLNKLKIWSFTHDHFWMRCFLRSYCALRGKCRLYSSGGYVLHVLTCDNHYRMWRMWCVFAGGCASCAEQNRLCC